MILHLYTTVLHSLVLLLYTLTSYLTARTPTEQDTSSPQIQLDSLNFAQDGKVAEDQSESSQLITTVDYGIQWWFGGGDDWKGLRCHRIGFEIRSTASRCGLEL